MQTIETQGIRLPRLGLGTYRLQGAECQAAVESALALGYRHIDTAAMYGNEEAVGAALAAAGLARDAVHLTTKVWHDALLSAADIRRAFTASLDKLGLDRVDLYLIHWPNPAMDPGLVFDTLMRLRDEGRVRAIGVANFPTRLLRVAVEEIGAPIACDQVEYHALLDQSALLGYLRSRAIPLVAYCPLAQGRLGDYPELAAIARKHDATPAQVALKWLLDQDGVAAIPKARGAERQRQNLAALALSLDDADRRVIASLPKDRRFVRPGFAPEWDAPVAA